MTGPDWEDVISGAPRGHRGHRTGRSPDLDEYLTVNDPLCDDPLNATDNAADDVADDARDTAPDAEPDADPDAGDGERITGDSPLADAPRDANTGGESTTEPTEPESAVAPTPDLTPEAVAPSDAEPHTDHDEEREGPMQTDTEDTIADDTEVGDTTDSNTTAAGDPPTPEQVNSLVKTYVISAMAISLVPVPVFDVAALVALQLKMIHSLARRYNVRFSESLAKSLVLSLIGGVLPIAAVASAGSLLKVVPVAGSLVGGASMSILGGAVTYAVGRIFAEHFASGGTLLTFRPAAVRGRFRDLFKRGKKEAADLDSEGTADRDEAATAPA